MLTVKDFVAVALLASVTLILKVKVPALVGLPEIVAFESEYVSFKPVGNVPLDYVHL